MNKNLVVITGVSQGLGRAMLERFSEYDNWIVAGCSRSEKEIIKLRTIFDQRHDFEVVDVSNADSVLRWSEKLLERYNLAPNLLINNAGIINTAAPLWEISPQEFDTVIKVNICGVANVIRAFVPGMIKHKKGILINMSSGWGREPAKNLAPYCASKFAVEGLTQSLALELPKGLAAVALDPRESINTPMLQKGVPEAVSTSPTPAQWSKVAVPYILSIGEQDNGKSLTCPLVAQ